MLAKHPDWTNAKIAGAVGCNKKYLSQDKTFREARRAIKELGRASLPRGYKSASGSMEASSNDERLESLWETG
jgi:hypothetical protein